MSQIFIYTLSHPETNEIRYVGKTYCPTTRLQQHISRSRQRNYHSANWVESLLNEGLSPKMEIIETTDDNNWEEREKFWIKKLNESCDLTNITKGGEGGITYGFKGKTHSKESIQKMIRARTGKKIKGKGENDGRAAAQRKRADENKRAVCQYDLNGSLVKQWKSATDCQNETGWERSNITRSCKNHNRTSNGFMWRFFDQTQGKDIDQYNYQGNKYNKKEIVQMSKEGHKIKIFSSIREASEELKISRTGISNCLSNKAKTSGGYKWKYK